MCRRCVEFKKFQKAARLKEKKERPKKLRQLREAFACLRSLAKLGRRDLDDLLLVANKMRAHKEFMKELASMTIDFEKYSSHKVLG